MSRFDSIREKRIKQVGRSILILLGVGMLYALFVTVTGWKIPCIFYEATGWYCPGCGMTRMCLALLRLDLRMAFRCNPLIFCLLPIIILVTGYMIIRYIRQGTWQVGKWMNGFLVLLTAALLIFGLLRNLPGMEVLCPPNL